MEIPKFKTGVFFHFLFEKTGQVCSGFGWNSDKVAVDLQTTFQFQNCYKTIISDLCDWKTFFSEDAKYYDGCNESTGGGAIDIKTWPITDAQTDKSLLGGTVAGGQGCWRFAEWTKWAPYLV